MADSSQHIVRHWLGTLEGYNKIKAANLIDPWIRYTVKTAVDDSVSGGTPGYVEYYGENRITPYYPGELLPVKDIVATLPENLTIGSRYLVGPSDAFEADGKLKSEDLQTSSDQWWITTIQGTVKTADGVNYLELIEPDLKKLGNLSVRVESYGLKAYVLVEGKLKTYDDVDCGTF